MTLACTSATRAFFGDAPGAGITSFERTLAVATCFVAFVISTFFSESAFVAFATAGASFAGAFASILASATTFTFGFGSTGVVPAAEFRVVATVAAVVCTFVFAFGADRFGADATVVVFKTPFDDAFTGAAIGGLAAGFAFTASCVVSFTGACASIDAACTTFGGCTLGLFGNSVDAL
jgi:hypothetical protein